MDNKQEKNNYMEKGYIKNRNEKGLFKNKNFLNSLKHALDGVLCVYKEEKNIMYHTLIALIIIGLSILLNISKLEWLIILLCIFLVFLMEFINTISENIVDMLVGNRYDETAKKVKDIAAATVLLSASFASIIGIVIFVPKIITLFIK